MHVGFIDTAVANIITSPPTNAMYQVGDVITLQCTVDSLAGDMLVWSSHYPNRAHALCIISHDKGSRCFLSRYSISTVNNVGGQGHTDYTLVIADAQLSDGGSYQCSFVRAASERSVATVVVVG